jgi:branched-chain amino acid transport system permease protein
MELGLGNVSQVAINGVVLGLIYALLALGFTLIFGIMGIVNLAHGSLYMVGGVITYYLFAGLGVNYFLTLVVVMAITGGSGVLLERVFFRRVRGTGFVSPMILSLGLLLLMEGAALIGFGHTDKGIPSAARGVLTIGGISVSAERLMILAVTATLVFGLFYFLNRVKAGQAMRALAQDPETAYLMGIDINWISMLSFALASSLAGVSGALLCPVSYLSYRLGSAIIIKCFIVVVLGGLGSVTGCLAGGLVLGLVESFALGVLPGHLSLLIIFAIVLTILLVRPQGIMGRAEV